jgi:hypothetical protein
MRDPPALLAGRSCAIRLRFSLDVHAGSALPSRAVTRPRSSVAVTVAGSVIAA